MTRVLALRLVLLVACLAPAWPTSARADDAATAEGDALKQQGDELFKMKRYEDALAKYDLAYERTRNPALLYNRARALEYMARYPEALASLERFQAEASPDLRAKVPGLDALVEDIRKKTARLTLTCNVQYARVVLRDRVLGTTPLPSMVVNAGAGILEVTAEGYVGWSRRLELAGGSEETVDVALALRPKEAPQVRVIRVEEGPLTSRWWFWTGVGVLVVGAAVGGYVALTTEQSPSRGEGFSVGNVSAPLVTFR